MGGYDHTKTTLFLRVAFADKQITEQIDIVMGKLQTHNNHNS